MTTASAAGGASPTGWRHRALMRLGHIERVYGSQAFALVMAVSALWVWVHRGAAGAVVAGACWASAGGYLLLLRGETIHGRNLCLRCSDDISAVLDDPQHAVETHDRQLRRFHFGRLPRKLWTGLGLFLAGYLLPAAKVGPWEMPATAGKVAGTALLVAATVVLWQGLTALSAHKRLGTWCPYCRHRGGGERQPTHTPTPEGVSS